MNEVGAVQTATEKKEGAEMAKRKNVKKDIRTALQMLLDAETVTPEGSTQSGAAPGEIIEGERATPSDPDEATAPDPTKKKSLLSMIFGKRGKRP